MFMTKYNTLLYYCYSAIADAEQFAADHLKFCKSLGLVGRIIVAEEGLNGTVSGTVDACKTYMDTIHADPKLLPLADNGGRSLTHALRPDSPALNRGNNIVEYANFTPITCDQRGNLSIPQSNPPNTDNCSMVNGGFLRVDSDPLHSHADIGAYEEQLPNPDWIFYDGMEGDYL